MATLVKLQTEIQNITYFEVTMKKFSRKLKMLKIASNKCHLFFQQNKIKELEIHCKTYEECERTEQLEKQSSTTYVREGLK